MKQELLDAVSAAYGFRGVAAAPAPRGRVAVTYTLNLTDGRRLFCKLVDHPLFVPKLLASLPVVDAMHRQGCERINTPIRTLAGDLCMRVDSAVLVVFNHIDAPQTERYSMESFGRLIASIQALTPKIDVPVPSESFAPAYLEGFATQFEQILTRPAGDQAVARVQRLFRQRETEIRRHMAALERLTQARREQPSTLVITHGDAGGNILAKSPTEVMLERLTF